MQDINTDIKNTYESKNFKYEDINNKLLIQIMHNERFLNFLKTQFEVQNQAMIQKNRYCIAFEGQRVIIRFYNHEITITPDNRKSSTLKDFIQVLNYCFERRWINFDHVFSYDLENKTIISNSLQYINGKLKFVRILTNEHMGIL